VRAKKRQGRKKKGENLWESHDTPLALRPKKPREKRGKKGSKALSANPKPLKFLSLSSEEGKRGKEEERSDRPRRWPMLNPFSSFYSPLLSIRREKKKG